VFHACRSQERADIAVKGAGGGVPLVCDLADFSSVRRFAEILEKEAPKLDVLCLNAGIAPSTKANKSPKITKDGFEECIGVNHLGHFLLANILKTHLAKDGGGRLVTTASSVHDPEGPGGAVGGEGGATVVICRVSVSGLTRIQRGQPCRMAQLSTTEAKFTRTRSCATSCFAERQ
jgi:NAD(P)-dependent dehydrogenase (short-subunit alcohol dehydrogenase family)